MLIDTINNYEKYFENFNLINFLDSVKVIQKFWEVQKIGGDDGWGVHLVLDEFLKADIYFLNERLLSHPYLYKEVGPSTEGLNECKYEKDLNSRGLNDKKYFAKFVELEMKKNILDLYNHKAHLKALEMYSSMGNKRFSIQPIITEIFSCGSPNEMFVDAKTKKVSFYYESKTCWTKEFELKEISPIIRIYGEEFFKNMKYSINFNQSVFSCGQKDVFEYIYKF